MQSKIEVVIIPVAGRGTRFLPITKVLSKTMLPIINKPTIHYIIEEAIDAGVKEAIIVLNNDQQDVINYFDDFSVYNQKTNKNYNELEQLKEINKKIKIHYIFQPHPYGAGDAIIRCEEIIDGRDFGILLGDDVVKKDEDESYGIATLIKLYEEKNQNIVGIQYVNLEDTSKYGIVELDRNNQIINLVEKPLYNPPSNYAIVGRYIFKNNFINYLKNLKLDKDNEIKLTDAIAIMAKEHKIYASTLNGKRFDIGDFVEYIIANIEFGLGNVDINNKIIDYLNRKNKQK